MRPPPNAWARGVVGWHLAFWLLWGLSVLAVLIWSSDLEVLGPRWVPPALLVVLGLAYLVFGQPAATSRDRTGAYVYLCVAVVSVSALLAVSPGLSFLLFLMYPQMWFLSGTSRQGTAFTLALSVGAATGLTIRGGTTEAALASFLSLGVSFVFSMMLGLWITRIITQSQERAELIAQLEATRADLARAHHEAGVVAERVRLAREIHDTIAQGLTSVVMMSQVAARELTAGRADEAAAKLATIQDAARLSLIDARALVASYAAVGIDDDLVAVLRRLATRFHAETGIRVDVVAPDDATGGAPPGHQVVLLRSVQEGLANVRKHAAATRVQITLCAGADGALQVEVRDDGVGFDPAAAGATGFGLAGLAGRADEVGGDLAVTSAVGRGTTLRVAVPARG